MDVDDADAAAVAAGVRAAGYYNSGQDCTAACRVIAGPKVHDDLVAALQADKKFRVVEATEDFKVLISEKKIRVAVELPAGFEAALKAGGVHNTMNQFAA